MPVLLFDIDGTLLFARGLGRTAFQDALAALCGREVSSDGIAFSGRTDRSLAREMLELAGHDTHETVIDAVLEAYADRFEASLLPSMVEVLPGVSDLLGELAGCGHLHLGLLTGNVERTGWAKVQAGGLRSYFGFGAFGSDHEDRNQLPAFARERAMATVGSPVAFEEMIVIGDTPHDVACGKAVGARTVAVCTGMVQRESLIQAGPDLLLADFTQPEALLELVRV